MFELIIAINILCVFISFCMIDSRKSYFWGIILLVSILSLFSISAIATGIIISSGG